MPTIGFPSLGEPAQSLIKSHLTPREVVMVKRIGIVGNFFLFTPDSRTPSNKEIYWREQLQRCFHQAPTPGVTAEYTFGVFYSSLLSQLNAEERDFFEAVLFINFEKVRNLLQQFPDLARRALFDRNRFTPLHYCVREERWELLNILLDAGANPNTSDQQHAWSVLHEAAQRNVSRAVKLLLSRRAEVNTEANFAPYPLPNYEGSTPLHVACSLGHVEVVMALLEADAFVNANDRERNTPLHLATGGNHFLCVALLLAADSTVNVLNENGFAPLHLAILAGKTRLVHLLLKHGAQTDLACHDYMAFHLAVSIGNISIMQLLIQHLADIHALTPHDDNSVHVAVDHKQVAALAFLLELGVQRDAWNQAGFTPLHLATRSGFLMGVQMLLGHGAEVNKRTRDCGKTASELAIYFGQPAVGRVLAEAKKRKNENVCEEQESVRKVRRGAGI